MKCAACGTDTVRRLCNFCRRTLQLIREGRCVSCAAPTYRNERRVEGKCDACMFRNERLCAATRKLLSLTADQRYRLRRAAA